MEQINDKKEKNIKKRETDRAIPDIAGDMGYPPRPQLSKYEERKKEMEGQKQLGEELKEQMKLDEQKR